MSSNIFPFSITAPMARVLSCCEHSKKPFHERGFKYTEYEIVINALEDLYRHFQSALSGAFQNGERTIRLIGTQKQARAMTVMQLFLEGLGYEVVQGTQTEQSRKETVTYLTLDVSF